MNYPPTVFVKSQHLKTKKRFLYGTVHVFEVICENAHDFTVISVL